MKTPNGTIGTMGEDEAQKKSKAHANSLLLIGTLILAG
jgi:hypothetical protein